jgi:hypothetical protein
LMNNIPRSGHRSRPHSHRASRSKQQTCFRPAASRSSAARACSFVIDTRYFGWFRALRSRGSTGKSSLHQRHDCSLVE